MKRFDLTEFQSGLVSRSDAARREAREAAFQHRYQRIESGACVYCGGNVQTLDHVPPLSAAMLYTDGDAHALYPSCNRCNGTLGARDLVCLVERSRWLLPRLLAQASAALGRSLGGKPGMTVGSIMDVCNAAHAAAICLHQLEDGEPERLCVCDKCKRSEGET